MKSRRQEVFSPPTPPEPRPPPEDDRIRLRGANERAIGTDGLEVTEDELIAKGVDLRRPTAFEAPLINFGVGGAARTRPLRAGEVVIVAVSSLDGDDSEQSDDDDEGPQPGWFRSRRERWGTLVGERGTTMPSTTNGDGGEVWHRVLVHSPCSAEYAIECDLAKEQDWRLDYLASEARRRLTGVYAAALGGFGTTDSSPRPPETPAPNPKAVTVLARRGDIFRPHERAEALKARRDKALRRTLTLVDKAVTAAASRTYFRQWRAVWDCWRMIREERAARTIQKNFRVGSPPHREGRATRQLQVAVRTEHAAGKVVLHARFKYLLRAEDQNRGYTANGKVFFATVLELNEWSALVRSTGAAMAARMVRAARGRKAYALQRWRNRAALMVDTGEPHYDGAAVSTVERPPQPQPRALVLPALPPLHARLGPDGSRAVTDAKKHAAFLRDAAGPADTMSWLVPGKILMGAHPSGDERWAVKMDIADAGAVAGAALNAGATLFVDLLPRREARAHEAAQPGWLELEAEGRGILRRAKEPARLAARPIQFGGRDDEEHGDEQHDGTVCAYAAALARARQKITALIIRSGGPVRAAESEVKSIRRYNVHDARHEEAEADFARVFARQRRLHAIAKKHKDAIDHLPQYVTTLRLPIEPDSDFGSDDDDDSALAACEEIERLMRDGHIVFIYSLLGHGRAGMLAALLLGRLYGLTCSDALFRVQVCHDARGCFASHDFAAPISCPQTPVQKAAVARLLLRTEVLYSEKAVTGRWPEHTRYFLPKRTKWAGGDFNRVLPTLRPSDPRAMASEAVQRNPLPTAAAQPGGDRRATVSRRASVSRPVLNVSKKERPPLLDAPTMRSLKPGTAAGEAAAPRIATAILPRLSKLDLNEGDDDSRTSSYT